MTLMVNLYGGPGTGKSTTAAGLFASLKARGVNTEYVPEFAKEVTWEGRKRVLDNQMYVTGTQSYYLRRLEGQVDVVVTDSPLLLGLAYCDLSLFGPMATLIRAERARNPQMDIMLQRTDRPYLAAGRSQTEDEARSLDGRIETILAWAALVEGCNTITSPAMDVAALLPMVLARMEQVSKV